MGPGIKELVCGVDNCCFNLLKTVYSVFNEKCFRMYRVYPVFQAHFSLLWIGQVGSIFYDVPFSYILIYVMCKSCVQVFAHRIPGKVCMNCVMKHCI